MVQIENIEVFYRNVMILLKGFFPIFYSERNNDGNKKAPWKDGAGEREKNVYHMGWERALQSGKFKWRRWLKVL